MYYFFIYVLLFCEGMASLISLMYWNKNKNIELKYFSLYLTFIFLVECLGKVSQYMQWNQFNLHLFLDFVIPIEFLFCFWFLSKLNNSSRIKKTVVVFSITYLIALIFDNIIVTNTYFNEISYTLGNLYLLILIIINLLKLISSDDIINFQTNPFFYIYIGLLIFYLGTFPFYGFKNLWAFNKNIRNYYGYVALALNCVMYCMFTISFICKSPKS